jgi:hypothetical protein
MVAGEGRALEATRGLVDGVDRVAEDVVGTRPTLGTGASAVKAVATVVALGAPGVDVTDRATSA